MKVRVLFFAQLKDMFGESECMRECDQGLSVRELVHSMAEERDLKECLNVPMLYAVNEEFATSNHELHDGDVVALLPPVSGG